MFRNRIILSGALLLCAPCFAAPQVAADSAKASAATDSCPTNALPMHTLIEFQISPTRWDRVTDSALCVIPGHESTFTVIFSGEPDAVVFSFRAVDASESFHHTSWVVSVGAREGIDDLGALTQAPLGRYLLQPYSEAQVLRFGSYQARARNLRLTLSINGS